MWRARINVEELGECTCCGVVQSLTRELTILSSFLSTLNIELVHKPSHSYKGEGRNMSSSSPSDGDKDKDGSSPSTHSNLAEPVEYLSMGRSKRSTAGNRMRQLLEQERERLEAEAEAEEEATTNMYGKQRDTENEDKDDNVMFLEEEGDIDFEEKDDDVYDIVDSDFDQSSDQGGDDDDEEQGEKALQEEERAAKKVRTRFCIQSVSVYCLLTSLLTLTTHLKGI